MLQSVYRPSHIATELGFNLNSDLECTKEENVMKMDENDRPSSRMYKMDEYKNWAKPLNDADCTSNVEKTKC